MRTSEDITASHGTTSQVTTTWAVAKVTQNTRRNIKSNEQGNVGYYRRLHINILIRLHNININEQSHKQVLGS